MMKQDIQMYGVRDYLIHLSKVGKTDDITFPELEKKFGITPYGIPGHRARKLWSRYLDSGKTVDNFIKSLHPAKSIISKVLGAISGNSATTEQITDAVTNSTYTNEKRDFEVKENGTAVFNGTTSTRITNPQEALEFSKVDLTKWKLVSHRFNSWDVTMKIEKVMDVGGTNQKVFVPHTVTNYGCELRFSPIDVAKNIQYEDILKDVDVAIKSWKSNPQKVSKEKRVGVLNLADFHIGADITQLIRTPEFNVDILIKYLETVATTINRHNYSDVHVNMLGDYFESISGLNHLNTFKSLGKGMYGSKVIILASKIIGHFLSGITNLRAVNIISGNHDRLTQQSDVDNEGGAAELLAHILETKTTNIKFNYHTYCLNPVIDDVCYILTHGHFKLDKKDIGKIVSLFGAKDKFNLWLSGHIHSRVTEKTRIERPVRFHNVEAISSDEAPYRKIVLPSLFTGNFYSETLGYTTNGGFVITENNGCGKPNVFDYTL